MCRKLHSWKYQVWQRESVKMTPASWNEAEGKCKDGSCQMNKQINKQTKRKTKAWKEKNERRKIVQREKNRKKKEKKKEKKERKYI